MISTNPVPTGQCRQCKHCCMTLWNSHPHTAWRQQCQMVEDVEPENGMTEEFAARLEVALIRLGKHYDCPEFTSK